MVARGTRAGRGALAADLAALMAEGDPLAGRDGAGEADVRTRLAFLRARSGEAEGARQRLRREARQIRRLAGVSER